MFVMIKQRGALFMWQNKQRIICCIIATILLFMGMCVETSATDSSFLCAKTSSKAVIRSASYIADEAETCTTDMLSRVNSSVRSNASSTTARWQSRVILGVLFVGASLQYLLYYQSAECKEDGQLFLCRSVAVDYIHQKDGEK